MRYFLNRSWDRDFVSWYRLLDSHLRQSRHPFWSAICLDWHKIHRAKSRTLEAHGHRALHYHQWSRHLRHSLKISFIFFDFLNFLFSIKIYWNKFLPSPMSMRSSILSRLFRLFLSNLAVLPKLPYFLSKYAAKSRASIKNCFIFRVNPSVPIARGNKGVYSIFSISYNRRGCVYWQFSCTYRWARVKTKTYPDLQIFALGRSYSVHPPGPRMKTRERNHRQFFRALLRCELFV